MKQSKLSVAIKATLLGASIALAPAAFAVDKELLDILKANGAISADQYTELSMSNMMNKGNKPSDELLKKMAWAGKIKIKGDLRLRQENNKGTSTKDGNKDRQRIRARIGVYADVADNVQVGVRLATGGSTTSANSTLEDDFDMKSIYLDLAYINWQPLNGLEVIGGKFKQPWEKVTGAMVWDGDVNPEGLALRYTTPFAGAKLIATAGHLVMSESSNDTVSEDAKVTFAQLAAKFKIAGSKTKVGVSIFDFDARNGTLPSIGLGNSADTEFNLSEVFAETNIQLGLPVKLYGHYVKNNDASGVNSSEDTAWLLGVGTKMGNWKASYDYRDTEANAVNSTFNDSDFAGGNTDSKGSRWKLAYKIDKNFSIATTYLDTEIGSLGSNKGDQDTWQIDLKAKF